jgi:hypothetical protein
VSSVEETHEFGSDVSVEGRRGIDVAGRIPSRREDEDVGKRFGWMARLGGQDSGDRGIDMIDQLRSNRRR